MEDIVITSYKQQIKESALKAEAVKAGGFDIVVEELENRGIRLGHLKEFFNKIMLAKTIDDLNQLTLNELNEIVMDINTQVTRALIAKVEIADALVRKSKLVALKKSPDGKVESNDNYVKVGSNLAATINKDGIAYGIDLCVRNYCNQKIYQANYREKMIEKEKELGIYDEEEKEINRNMINEKMDSISSNNISPKNRLLKTIFDRDINDESLLDFETAKQQYRESINQRMLHLNEMK